MAKSDPYNPILDVVKFILAGMVICIHFVMPEPIGGIADCIARIAVPFFFLISGYYAYNCTMGLLWRRTGKNLLFLVGSTLLYLIWGIWRVLYINKADVSAYLHERINRSTATDFILYGINPFSNQLWFLEALVVAYIAFILIHITIKNDSIRNGIVISIMLVLLGAHLWLGSVIPIISEESVPHHYYRNAWLFGIPLFLGGFCIRLFKEKGWKPTKSKKLFMTILFFIGIVLGLLQWFKYGKTEMPFGILLATVTLFLYLTESSKQKCDTDSYGKLVRITKVLGKASVWVYVIHKLVGEVIQAYAPSNTACNQVCSNGYLFTVVVIMISICMSLIITICVRSIKKVLKHT